MKKILIVALILTVALFAEYGEYIGNTISGCLSKMGRKYPNTFNEKFYANCVKDYKNLEDLKGDIAYFKKIQAYALRINNYKENNITRAWERRMGIAGEFAYVEDYKKEAKERKLRYKKKLKTLTKKFKKKPNAKTAYEIGRIYRHYLVPDRPKKALPWYKKCYELGDYTCSIVVASIYEEFKNYDKAAIWYKKGINYNNTLSIIHYSFLLSRQNKKIESMAYYMLSIAYGVDKKYAFKYLLKKGKDGWSATKEELKKAYKLQLTFPYKKLYRGGIN